MTDIREFIRTATTEQLLGVALNAISEIVHRKVAIKAATYEASIVSKIYTSLDNIFQGEGRSEP